MIVHSCALMPKVERQTFVAEVWAFVIASVVIVFVSFSLDLFVVLWSHSHFFSTPFFLLSCVERLSCG
jgi:hypothetical protein